MDKLNDKVIIADDKVAAVCCGYDDASGEMKPCREIFAFDLNLIEGKTPIDFTCPVCGSVNIGMELAKEHTKLGNLIAKNYLECIIYAGPLGKGAEAAINDGNKKLYVDLFGTQFSRNEYMAQKGKDPSPPILKMIKENAIVDHHRPAKTVSTGSDEVGTICAGYSDAGGVRKTCHEIFKINKKVFRKLSIPQNVDAAI